MVHKIITDYLQAHGTDFGFVATEVTYNPYLRNGDGRETSWHVVLTYKPTAAQFRCHYSSDVPEITLASVLDVIRSEILLLAEYPTYLEYAEQIGLPHNDAMDERDARRVFAVALRHREEFIETFGPAAEYLLGYREIQADDGLGFW